MEEVGLAGDHTSYRRFLKHTIFPLPWGLCTPTLTVIYSLTFYMPVRLYFRPQPKGLQDCRKDVPDFPFLFNQIQSLGTEAQPGAQVQAPTGSTTPIPHHTPPVWPHHTICADLDDYYINVSLSPWTQSSVGD